MISIPRPVYRSLVETALRRAPVVALLGPRQCGKSTLARQIAADRPGGVTFLDLESADDLAALQNPQLFLSAQRGLVILDEIQTRPDLFPVLRVLADREDAPARFLLLGSASPQLGADAAETLAGRVEFVEMHPFHLAETGGDTDPEKLDALWRRGGFPRSWLAENEEASLAWRDNFIQTFLMRDVALRLPERDTAALRRFWMMLAHYHGQIFNASELARSLGIGAAAVRRQLDVLEGTYMVRVLPPWHENFGKRVVKAPKIYLRDSGLFHALLGLRDRDALWHSPKAGASWEGFALEQTLAVLRPAEAWFWALHSGAEVDLFCLINGRRTGIEFKWSEKPATTKSMHAAIETLRLDRLWVVYPGGHVAPLTDKITLLPLARAGEIGA
ncbi:MAG: ATP-binding protein [Opitutaceae bacterium]|jgi:predicted AAA+ superfamily ATPase|nr:ATP-binding protein [Opitutaceae bacterium]